MDSVAFLDEQGKIFSKAVITDYKNGKIYVKYLDQYKREDYGFFDFDLAFKYPEAVEQKKISII